MIKKILVVVLSVSTIIEICLGVGSLLYPEKMMGAFGITSLNGEVLYLACIIGWFCLAVSAVAGLAAFWIYKDKAEGYWLSLIVGIFWTGIGLHLGFVFARPQHLALDAAKGILILALTFFIYSKQPKETKG